ncbi:MAG: hypothetical protein KJ737_13795 [Proteobacteria bacterium]|nr:hypothetical protein [Pseudomonadota bacterium]
MSKFTLAGLLSWLGGFLLLGFQSISTLMSVEGKWKSMNLKDVVDAQYLTWVDGITWDMLTKMVDYVLTMPLFVLLFCVGTILFIVNAFFE